MSDAALALALALLVAPVSSRHRVHIRRSVVPMRLILPTCAVALAVALVVLASPGVVVAVTLICVTVGMRLRQRRRERRRTAEATALQAALDVLVGELQVGAHPVAALGVTVKEADDVIAPSLRTVASRARLGADIAEAVHAAARQSSLPGHWERLAVCWHLAQVNGLGIAAMLQTAQRDIVERQRFSARVDAGMAGARTTAAVLAGLPAVGIGLGQLIGADPLGFLLSGGSGDWLLVIGVALACAGLTWSDRITNQVVK